ncbi:unnamed protein product [Boreogadus saida]
MTTVKKGSHKIISRCNRGHVSASAGGDLIQISGLRPSVSSEITFSNDEEEVWCCCKGPIYNNTSQPDRDVTPGPGRHWAGTSLYRDVTPGPRRHWTGTSRLRDRDVTGPGCHWTGRHWAGTSLGRDVTGLERHWTGTSRLRDRDVTIPRRHARPETSLDRDVTPQRPGRHWTGMSLDGTSLGRDVTGPGRHWTGTSLDRDVTPQRPGRHWTGTSLDRDVTGPGRHWAGTSLDWNVTGPGRHASETGTSQRPGRHWAGTSLGRDVTPQRPGRLRDRDASDTGAPRTPGRLGDWEASETTPAAPRGLVS